MTFKQLLTTIFLIVGCSLVSSDPLPDARNVCNISIPIKKDKIIETPVEYEIKFKGMCGILPCMKTRTERRIDQTFKTILYYQERAQCCPGYTETPERQCVPICLDSCQNGARCVAPNTCECRPAPSELKPGFAGPTCARFVCAPEDRWGAQCDKQCNCPVNAFCGANTGKCLCYPGYRGTNCTIECERGSKDPECEELSELPPLIEPDANLVFDNSVNARRRSEALVLERTPDETLQLDDRSSFGANYLVGVLSCFTLISIISFLIIKRRYDKLKTEMCYGATGTCGSLSTGSGGDDYSNSIYYDASQAGAISARIPRDEFLAKNLSFSAATRQMLLGSLDNNKANNTQQNNDQQQQQQQRNKLIVNPLIESRLIRSHKASEQNLYTDVGVNFLDRPLPTPDESSTTIDMSSDDHIYQVPRRAKESMDDSSVINDTSSESLYKSIAEDAIGEDIYEEIKPRLSPK